MNDIPFEESADALDEPQNPQRFILPESALKLYELDYIIDKIKEYKGPIKGCGRPKFKEFRSWFSYVPFLKHDNIKIQKKTFKKAWKRLEKLERRRKLADLRVKF